MIQTPEGQDRGKALLKMFPDEITNMVKHRKNSYFESGKYKRLKNNCVLMDQYVDGKNPSASTFMSDVNPQLIRKSYVDYVSLFTEFLKNDPIFNFTSGNSQLDVIRNAIMAENIKKTNFRERCLEWNVDHVVRYGTYVNYSFAATDYNSNALLTVKADDSYDDNTYVQEVSKGGPAAVSLPIHPLHAIVDPCSNFMQSPDYLGIMCDISIAGIIQLMDNPNYIADNIKKIVNQCKNGMPDEHWYTGDGKGSKTRGDFTKGHSTITYMWTPLPFEGNEDDYRWYAIEEIGGTIIRIDENPLDENTVPIAIGRILRRQYDWFGNSVLTDKISLQNLAYWQINTNIESTSRLMDRIILYREGGGIDRVALDQRHQTGGLVPYNGQVADLSQVLYSPQFGNNAYRENDWMWQFIRREDADSSAMPNFNPQAEGGPTNKTLGGAQMIASIGEMKMSKHVSDMVSGIKDTAKQQLILLRNILPDEHPAKQALVEQSDIEVLTANVFNYAKEAIEAQNRLTAVLNITASGRPETQGIKIGKFVEDFVRASVKKQDIEDYYQEAPPQPPVPPQVQGVPGAMPQPPAGGMPPPQIGPQGGPLVQ